jgi:hypothetical protein
LQIFFPVAGGPDQNEVLISVRLTSNPLTEREPIHARQKQVKEQEWVIGSVIGFDGLLCSGTSDYVIASAAQYAAED